MSARRDGAGRFEKGRSGNPKGRPKGRYRSGTRAAAALLDAEAERLAEKAIELALGGDPVAVRFCLGRVLGTRRGQPVALDLPEIAAPRDLPDAVAALTEALADGRLTPDEALAVSRMLDGFPGVFAAAAADATSEPAPEIDPKLVLLATLRRLLAANLLPEPQASDARRWLLGEPVSDPPEPWDCDPDRLPPAGGA